MFENINFLIESENRVLLFSQSDESVFLTQYADSKIIFNKSILDECKKLNNVIFSDNTISIIYTNTKNELVMAKFEDDNIVKTVRLLRDTNEFNNLSVASVNEVLNIFYTTVVNNMIVLCYRVLTKRLTLTSPIIIDMVDISGEVPYCISANSSQLAVFYIKSSTVKEIGYRKLDFETNTWGPFNVIDRIYYKITEANFIIDNENIIYSYSMIKHKRGNIIWGKIKEDKINMKFIEQINSDRVDSVVILDENKEINLINIIDNKITIKIGQENGEATIVKEINLNKITKISKGIFTGELKSISNNGLIVENEENIILAYKSDMELLLKKQLQDKVEEGNDNSNIKLDSNIELLNSKEEEKNIETANNVEVNEDIDKSEAVEEKRDNNSPVNEDMITITKENPTIIISSDEIIREESQDESLTLDNYSEKIKSITREYDNRIEDYKKTINNFSAEINSFISVNTSLQEELDKLNENINTKTDKITSLENLLVRKNEIIQRCKVKIEELIETNKENEENRKIEISNLKGTVNSNEDQKNNFLIEIDNYIGKIKFLNDMIDQKDEYINMLKKENEEIKRLTKSKEEELNKIKFQLSNYSDNSNLEVTSLTNTINKYNLEKANYVNKIQILKDKIKQLNIIVDNLKNENNSLKNKIASLDYANKNSVIRKMFKNQ